MKYFVSLTLLSLITISCVLSQWTKQSFPTTETLWKVRFANEQTGWIAAHNYIYKTTNGGGSWIKQDTSIGACDAMYVLSDQIALFANWTSAGEFSRGMRRTTDGGATWTTANAEKNYYSDIDFGSPTVGYACGGSGTPGNKPMVKKTTDAGATWTTVSQLFPKAKFELTGIAFVDENIGWAVSYDGFVFKTTNGGIDWSSPDSLGYESFRDIEFFNKDTGWVFGGIAGEMVIARTTNGGTTWTKIKKGGGSLREAESLTSTTVWCAGWNDSIIYSTNAGADWIAQKSDRYGFESIDMVNNNIGYVVASSGKVYKTTNGGVASVSTQRLNGVPTSYSVEQNYPNPFNPSTFIQFSIPKQGYTSLKIYSINGELVEELLHRTIDAGTYSVQWNAQQYSSGVYFYTLSSGIFSQTKKLVLVK